MRRVVLLGALVVVLLSVPSLSAALDVGVVRLNAAQMLRVGAAAPYSAVVPAQAAVTFLTSGGGAAKWVALAINSTAAGKLMQATMWAAGLYMAGDLADRLLKEYWASKGYAVGSDGKLGYPTVTPTSGNAPSPTPGGLAGEGEDTGVYIHYQMGNYASAGAAYAACESLRASGAWGSYSGCSHGWTLQPSGVALVGWARYSYTGYAAGRSRQGHFYYSTGGTYTAGGAPVQPVAPSEAQAAAQSDIGSGNASAWAALKTSLEAVGSALENNTHALNRATSEMSAIRTELNNALSQAQKDSVASESGGDTDQWADSNKTNEVTVKNMLTRAEVEAAVIAALAAKGLSQAEIQAGMSGALQANAALFSGGSGLTQAQIQSAIEDALTAKGLSYDGIINALTGVLGPASGAPYDPTALSPEALPDAPEKKSLPGVLSTFWEAFENLPVISLLNTFEVTASGSPVLTLSLPGLLGGDSGTANIDFSQWQDTFAVMGNVLLTIVGIRWTIYLFEG
jgi:hypothetical protein